MQLSKKQKAFSQYFAAFEKSTSNFEHFENKMSLIADETVKDVNQMFKKPDFRTPFDNQHVKGSQTLLKSARPK